jgi:thiamine-phosphate pyrophosphorylase
MTLSQNAAGAARCRLYLITPAALNPRDFAPRLEEALSAGDVACLQLRLKEASDTLWRAAIDTLMPIAHAHDVAFVINDRPDLAFESRADGCHIGQEDMAYEQARSLVGSKAIVGITCHNSRHLAMLAGEAGADYVAFGAFFPTTTKTPKSKAEPELLSWWSSIFEIPCVAIGGITEHNCTPLIRAGADFIAISAGVWEHCKGPAHAVKAINAAIAAA